MLGRQVGFLDYLGLPVLFYSAGICLSALIPLPMHIFLFAVRFPALWGMFATNYNLSVESVIYSSAIALVTLGAFPTAWLVLDSANHRKELTTPWIWCTLFWSWITVPIWLIKRDEANGDTQSKFWKLFSYLSISAFIVKLAQQLYERYLQTLAPCPSAVTASGFANPSPTIDFGGAIYLALVFALYALPLILVLSFTFGFRIQAKETSSKDLA
ncbi:MAG: hypothetical protein IAF58_07295 [Leptolyngbya sp.]|nr:hypothetical protein [Candidatus Melainabacteria bacterium]